MTDRGCLVAQIGDTVRLLEPGPLYGTFGKVIAQHTDTEASPGTARICAVLSDSGAILDVSADRLKVL